MEIQVCDRIQEVAGEDGQCCTLGAEKRRYKKLPELIQIFSPDNKYSADERSFLSCHDNGSLSCNTKFPLFQISHCWCNCCAVEACKQLLGAGADFWKKN
jgi:hypothetical protein